ncbi:hypothetical protein K435DRAFT_797980 [Dendrothele bispora CBS 962.96]|uniref:Uncharacterized protein n=1 Tax=Dendrothele bispora (strain CBS 962.96) TaxID=1314807 RepID=A0A4S8M114_DENBC|nr:hypothetical protein K435DRAFT_797980 [Dendrothele bispora CBS 962.96]
MDGVLFIFFKLNPSRFDGGLTSQILSADTTNSASDNAFTDDVPNHTSGADTTSDSPGTTATIDLPGATPTDSPGTTPTTDISSDVAEHPNLGLPSTTREILVTSTKPPHPATSEVVIITSTKPPRPGQTTSEVVIITSTKSPQPDQIATSEVVIITSTIVEPISQSQVQTLQGSDNPTSATSTGGDQRSNLTAASFFNNRPAVIGTFTVVGIIFIAFMGFGVIKLLRKRKLLTSTAEKGRIYSEVVDN